MKLDIGNRLQNSQTISFDKLRITNIVMVSMSNHEQSKAIKMPRINIETPVRFKCKIDCSNCCKTGGVVLISEDDVPKISKYLKLSKEDFLKRYTKKEGKKIFLIDREIDDCIFLEDNKCRIYPVRPIQCRTFPFWPQNLKSEKRWNIIMDECPGIGEGKEFTRADIEEVFDGKAVDSVK